MSDSFKADAYAVTAEHQTQFSHQSGCRLLKTGWLQRTGDQFERDQQLIPTPGMLTQDERLEPTATPLQLAHDHSGIELAAALEFDRDHCVQVTVHRDRIGARVTARR